MDDLEETQYEHYISEQKKLLDNLYDEYEAILNERLDNIDALISDMIDVLSQLAKVSAPMSGKDTTNIGDITYQVTIPIEHVQDYNDFMNQMRKDGKFEKMIRSMTVDQLSGGSKLSKNKYQW